MSNISEFHNIILIVLGIGALLYCLRYIIQSMKKAILFKFGYVEFIIELLTFVSNISNTENGFRVVNIIILFGLMEKW